MRLLSPLSFDFSRNLLTKHCRKPCCRHHHPLEKHYHKPLIILQADTIFNALTSLDGVLAAKLQEASLAALALLEKESREQGIQLQLAPYAFPASFFEPFSCFNIMFAGTPVAPPPISFVACASSSKLTTATRPSAELRPTSSVTLLCVSCINFV